MTRQVVIVLALMFSITAVPTSVWSFNQPPAPDKPVTMTLLSVTATSVIANEREFTVTPHTIVQDKKGNRITVYGLQPKSRIQITYRFDPVSNKPVATTIIQK